MPSPNETLRIAKNISDPAHVGTGFSSAITNSTAETEFDNAVLVIPPNYLKKGSVIRMAWSLHLTGFTGTPTMTERVRLGPTSTAVASRTSIFTGGAIGAATDIMWMVDLMGTVHDVGPAASFAGHAVYREGTSAGSSNALQVGLSTAITIDTTVSNTLSITGDWSVANQANTVVCKQAVYEILNR